MITEEIDIYNFISKKEKENIDAVPRNILATPTHGSAEAGNPDSEETRSSRSACQVC